MAGLKVDITYATALFNAGKDTKQVEVFQEELEALSAIFRNEPSLFQIIATPVVPKKEKKELLISIFKGRVSEEMLNFLCVLVDRGRAAKFKDIAKQYKKIVDQNNRISEGDIFSPKKLSAKQILDFQEKVGGLINQNVKLINKIDNSLIGGVKVYIEGKVIDASVKTRLRVLKENIDNA